jgi:dephospho-CoA kinase
MGLRVGLTGGLACGKSMVAKMFSALGARVIKADTIAHELMRPGQPVYDEVVRRFGSEIVQPDGAIDRKKLAELAFGGNRVQELNNIVHPAVIRRQEQWMAEIEVNEPGAIAIVEAALIFEASVSRRFDRLIVVTCTPEQKKQRFAERMLLPAERNDPEKLQAVNEEAERRIRAQMPDSEKIAAAHFVIDNSGSLERTREQVLEIYDKLKAILNAATETRQRL